MAQQSASIRLGIEGDAEVLAKLAAIGKGGETAMSETVKAVTAANASLQQLGRSVADAATASDRATQQIGRNMDSLNAKSQVTARGTATAITQTVELATSRITALIGRAQSAYQTFQNLRDRMISGVAGLQMNFASGQQSTLDNIIANASMARLAGGPVGMGAVIAGFAYQQTSQYAALGDAAQKAKVTAQEMEGLRVVLGRLGLDASGTDKLFADFAARLDEARQRGGGVREALEAAGAVLRTQDGQVRSNVSVMQDLIRAYQAAESETDRARIAAQAFGEQADIMRGIVDKSGTSLTNLGTAAAQAGSVLANDLAKGAQAAMGVLRELGSQADGTYAQIRRALGAVDNLTQLKAAEQDVHDRQADLNRARRRDIPVIWNPLRPGDQRTDPADAQKALEAAQKRLAILRGPMPPVGNDDFSRRADAFLRGPTLKNEPYGPPAPDKGEDAGGRGGGRAAATKAETDAFQREMETLEKLNSVLGMSEEAKAVYEAQQRAGVDANSAQGDAIQDLIQDIYAQKAALQELKDAQAETNREAQQFGQIGSQAFASVVFQGGKVGDVLTRIVQQLATKQLQLLLTNAFSGTGGGGIFSTIASWFSGGAAGQPLNILPHYADGGIATRPSLAGEGGWPEAVIPLKGGGVPVTLSGPAAATQVVQPIVNINNEVPDAHVSARTNRDGSIDISVITKTQEDAFAQRIGREQGALGRMFKRAAPKIG